MNMKNFFIIGLSLILAGWLTFPLSRSFAQTQPGMMGGGMMGGSGMWAGRANRGSFLGWSGVWDIQYFLWILIEILLVIVLLLVVWKLLLKK